MVLTFRQVYRLLKEAHLRGTHPTRMGEAALPFDRPLDLLGVLSDVEGHLDRLEQPEKTGFP